MVSKAKLIPGVKLTKYVRDGYGSVDRAWIASANFYVKPSSDQHPCVVINEYLCARLGFALGLPIPAGELAKDAGGNTVWASALVGLDGQPLPPPDPKEIVAAEPSLSAGIAVFDTWIANGDRHEDNIIYHPLIGLWIYDHDKTLGCDVTFDPDALKSCKDLPLATHLFSNQGISWVKLDDWCKRVWNIPRTAVEAVVHGGHRRGLYPANSRDAIADFLESRRSQLVHLVKKSIVAHDEKDARGDEAGEGGSA